MNATKSGSVVTVTKVSGGFADYNDTSTTTIPLVLTADTWTDIPNNGAGSNTNLGSLPYGVTRLMNTTNGKLVFDELSVGDFVTIRNDIVVKPKVNNSRVETRYVLGVGAGQYFLSSASERLDSGSGIEYNFTLKPDFVYVGDSNTKDNPVTIQIKLNCDGVLINKGTAIGVNKNG